MKDITIRARFVFPPNFRKAVAYRLGQKTASHADMLAFIQKAVQSAQWDAENTYYSAKAKETSNV